MKHRLLIAVEQLPILQNKIYHSADKAQLCPKGDVRLVQNLETGLIYNSAFDASLLDYDEDYQNEQASSTVFLVHLDHVTHVIRKHFAQMSLIEIGCGKGSFLEHLLDQGYDVRGMDPAYEGNNPRILKQNFVPAVSEPADGIILRHVLEHICDPVAFLHQVAEANGGRGRIYIEVPCLEWIVEHRAWFDVSYEHVNYFRLSDVHRMFDRVLESGHMFGGQYLYAVADLATVRQPKAVTSDEIEFPDDMVASIANLASRYQDTRRCVVWGAASKGVISSLHLLRAGAAVDFLIDISPAKQGRFAAGTGLPILAPEVAYARMLDGMDLLVMNSNYLDEIKGMSGHRYNYLELDKHYTV